MDDQRARISGSTSGALFSSLMRAVGPEYSSPLISMAFFSGHRCREHYAEIADVGGELIIMPLSVAGTGHGSKISSGNRPSELFPDLILALLYRG